MQGALELQSPLGARRCVPMYGATIETLPDWGWRVDTERYVAKYTPAGPLELNMRAPMNLIGFTFGRYDGMMAIDSDRARRHAESTMNYLSFTPRGCEVRLCTAMNPDYTVIGVSDQTLLALHDELCGDRVFDKRYVAGLVSPRLAQIGRRLRHWFRFGEAGEVAALDELALALSACAVRLLAQNGETATTNAPLSPQQFRRAIDFVEASLESKVGVFDVASACGMSPFQFSRRFSATAGLSPHQYLIERRLARARERLRAGHEPIAHIAYASGFASHSHLTRTFQKLLGTTPSAYRSAYR